METTQPEAQYQPEPTVEQPANWKRFVLDILETLILAVVLYFGINAVSARVRVDGFSMRPTLQDGEYILVNKLAYKTGEPHARRHCRFHFPGQPAGGLDQTGDRSARGIGFRPQWRCHRQWRSTDRTLYCQPARL